MRKTAVTVAVALALLIAGSLTLVPANAGDSDVTRIHLVE